jgi:polyribonucleotide nucleotidyltransferase
VSSVEDHLKEGDEIDVKVIEVDKSGKIRLSRKALLPAPERGGGSGGHHSKSSGGGGGAIKPRPHDRS